MLFFDQSYLSKVECDAPQHCCKNGNQGCEGKCIPELWINDGEEDCDDGSDEKGMWKFEINKFLISVWSLECKSTCKNVCFFSVAYTFSNVKPTNFI